MKQLPNLPKNVYCFKTFPELKNHLIDQFLIAWEFLDENGFTQTRSVSLHYSPVGDDDYYHEKSGIPVWRVEKDRNRTALLLSADNFESDEEIKLELTSALVDDFNIPPHLVEFLSID